MKRLLLISMICLQTITFLYSFDTLPVSSQGETLLQPPFRFAYERLFDDDSYFRVQGQRIGFFGNQTSIKTLDKLIDDPQVEVARIFVPEHGLMGIVGAGDHVSDSTYRNIPVVSAYGPGTRKINPDKLKDLDLLVFEIQDIGNRHYTYVTSLYLQMDSCADAGIPLLLLDRPNAAGDLIEGPILESDRQSYIGLFGPVAHGMTLGELARFFVNEDYWLNGERYPRLHGEDPPFANLSELELWVIPMENYDRSKGFYQSGITADDWVPTSPNIPSAESAICYKGNGLLDGHEIKEIVSRYSENDVEQFVSIQLPRMEEKEALQDFITACYRSYAFPGVEIHAQQNKITEAWDILTFEVTRLDRYHSTLSILAILYQWEIQKHPGADHGFSSRERFDKSMGNDWVSRILLRPERYEFTDIIQLLEIDESLFREARRPYLLYPEVK